ncbi:MAG TPA: Crp/Fnr family transcriptional regulator [Methylotenera sp.]|nr:Crp/Fnr family transcriptional regulator [Methylotenera sp.]
MNTLQKALLNTSINITTVLSSDPLGPRQNHLLAALPYSELSLWEHELELVDLKLGQILCEPGVKHTHVIFPTTAIVSLLYMTQEGTSSEIAIVGNDGVVGVSVFMGGNETPNQAMVQSSGQGYRLRTQTAKNVVNRDGPLLHMLLRYTQTMITQIAQTAVCNRHHSIDQQLCRRLLLGLDRLPADDLVMTQELLASLLGVRRESVTTAAVKLQEAGVINYCRGHITVLNRKMLESRCCECYAMVKKEQDRLMLFMPEFHPAVQPSVSMAYSL